MPTNYEVPFRIVYVGLGYFTEDSTAKLEISGKNNSFYLKFHLNSVASISSKNSKKVVMSKYSLARKLFGLEESDSDDSERSVIHISDI